MSQITGTLIQRKVVNNHLYCVVQTDVDDVQKNHIVYFDVRDTQQAVQMCKTPLLSAISVKGRNVYRTMKDPRFKKGKVSLFEAQEIVVKHSEPFLAPLVRVAWSFCFVMLLACIPSR